MVAFHFQFANRAGWRCEECRKNGLERKRRCGWLAGELRGERHVVWARRSVRVDECPKSLVTAESVSLVEAFAAWKLAGGGDAGGLAARTADAFCVLESELRAEMAHGTE
ncbi:MAG: hypothetical protein HY822_19380 [Acidobacteria bacterium]|nr:hypothetical protein [Acidobacteriota bacterium]